MAADIADSAQSVLDVSLQPFGAVVPRHQLEVQLRLLDSGGFAAAIAAQHGSRLRRQLAFEQPRDGRKHLLLVAHSRQISHALAKPAKAAAGARVRPSTPSSSP